MDAILKLQCPNCNAVLNVKNAAGQDEKLITCPRCKVSNKIKNFKAVTVRQKVQSDEKTEFDQPTSLNLGQSKSQTESVSYSLYDVRSGKMYKLNKGRNLVGRKTLGSPSVADVQIETQDLGFSRAHLYIEIVSFASMDKIFLSNARNKNQTFVNSESVEVDDKLVLHNGDIIMSSETSLKFVIE